MKISCFSLDGQSKPPYVWINIESTDNLTFIKHNMKGASDSNMYKVLLLSENGSKNIYCFDMKSGLRALVSPGIGDSFVYDLGIVVTMNANTDRSIRSPFRIVNGNGTNDSKGEYFLLVTLRKYYYRFFLVKNGNVARYPVLLHSSIESTFAETPRTVRGKLSQEEEEKIERCSYCGICVDPNFPLRSRKIVFCSQECLESFSQNI